MFCFESGVKPSIEQIIFQYTRVGKRRNLKTDVVDSNTSLLLSKSAKKSAGIKFSDSTTSGHYCLPLSNLEIPQEMYSFTEHTNTCNLITKIELQNFARSTIDGRQFLEQRI